MRIFIPFERSGKVRRVMRARGHDAWSCDIVPADDGSEFHLLGDYREFVRMNWDMMIAFPVCTTTCVSGNGTYADTRARYEGVRNFMEVWHQPIKKRCLENPRSVIATQFMPPTQTIHPWEHGHKEMKPTCLWLVGLPKIVPTNIVGPPPDDPVEKRKWQKIWTMGPSDTRQIDRAETYDGIANAFGEQWG